MRMYRMMCPACGWLYYGNSTIVVPSHGRQAGGDLCPGSGKVPAMPVPDLPDARTAYQRYRAGEGPHCKPSYVYVASSWRNYLQPAVVAVLRASGIDCYDFKNPAPEKSGFSWKSIDPNWQQWTPQQWRDAIGGPIAKEGYALDKGGMDKADACVLVLPAGRSAHLEAGYMAGQGKPVFTLALAKEEPDLMTLLLGPPEYLCTSMVELMDCLGIDP